MWCCAACFVHSLLCISRSLRCCAGGGRPAGRAGSGTVTRCNTHANCNSQCRRVRSPDTLSGTGIPGAAQGSTERRARRVNGSPGATRADTERRRRLYQSPAGENRFWSPRKGSLSPAAGATQFWSPRKGSLSPVGSGPPERPFAATLRSGSKGACWVPGGSSKATFHRFGSMQAAEGVSRKVGYRCGFRMRPHWQSSWSCTITLQRSSSAGPKGSRDLFAML